MMPPENLRMMYQPVMPINGNFVFQAKQIGGYYNVPQALGCIKYLYESGFLHSCQAEKMLLYIKNRMPDPSKMVYCLEASP